jgi:hypothetical protein
MRGETIIIRSYVDGYAEAGMRHRAVKHSRKFSSIVAHCNYGNLTRAAGDIVAQLG